MAITDLLKTAAPSAKTISAAPAPAIPTLGPANPNSSSAEEMRAGIQASAPQEVKPLAPYHDPEYERAVNWVNTGLANLQSSRTTGEQRVNEDFDTASRKAGTQNEQNLSALQNKLANQGIGYSGINVAEQGRLGQNYQDVIGALTTGRKRGLEDIATDYAERQAGYQDYLAQAEIGKGERQRQREENAAADAAQAQAAQQAADSSRQFLEGLSASLTAGLQPQTTPTGQMTAPKPQAVVQQALQQLPPPQKTPQQQVADMKIDPRQLQDFLRIAGFDPGKTDGVFGRNSQIALANFKKSIGLPATGDIDQNVWDRLVQAVVGPADAMADADNAAFAMNQPGYTTQAQANATNQRFAANPQYPSLNQMMGFR